MKYETGECAVVLVIYEVSERGKRQHILRYIGIGKNLEIMPILKSYIDTPLELFQFSKDSKQY